MWPPACIDPQKKHSPRSEFPAEFTQVDFEVDRPPPADCPPGNLLIIMVKEALVLHKKDFRKKEKSET